MIWEQKVPGWALGMRKGTYIHAQERAESAMPEHVQLHDRNNSHTQKPLTPDKSGDQGENDEPQEKSHLIDYCATDE